MVNVAVLGRNEFVLGFQLAGIRETIEAGPNPMDDINALRKNKGIGIVVIDEQIMGSLQQHQRQEIEDSVEPVFIPLSTKAEQESLRRLVKKSIGIDLMGND